MSIAARLAQLSGRDRLLLLEAMFCLAAASLLISLASFAKVVRFAIGGSTNARPAPVELASRLAWALTACANFVPWTAVCFHRGLAAQMMLRRRGLAATVHYGLRREKDGALAAHVWVRSAEVDVIGCENAADFQLVTSFGAGGRPV